MAKLEDASKEMEQKMEEERRKADQQAAEMQRKIQEMQEMERQMQEMHRQLAVCSCNIFCWCCRQLLCLTSCNVADTRRLLTRWQPRKQLWARRPLLSWRV